MQIGWWKTIGSALGRWKYVIAAFVVGGFAGAGAIIASIEVNKHTSTEKFCAGTCHVMASMAADPHYLGSVHMSNPAGIRPSCGDCHIPKTNWFVETYVHITSGIHDVIAVMTKDFDDPKVWDARRAEMEKEVRDTMRAENNVTCLSCHSFASIKPTSSAGQSSHAMLKDTKMACADCHTNLVHGPVASTAEKK